jgi:hypothetical protein
MQTHDTHAARAPAELESVVREHVAALKKSIVRGRLVSAVLLAAVATWLTWLHGQIASVDADGIAALARARAVEKIPELSRKLQARMEEAAPEVVDRLAQRALAAPALLRERLEAEADALIATAREELRIGFAEHLQLDVAGAREAIDARYPGLDEREQLRALVRDAAREQRMQVWSLISSPAAESELLCGQIAAEIERLSRGESLTPEERTQREILCTLAALAPRLEPVELASLDRQLDELRGAVAR